MGNNNSKPPACPFCAYEDTSNDGERIKCDWCGAEAPIKAWYFRLPNWQPIDTSPKDGTRIITFGPEGICMARYTKSVRKEFWESDCEYEINPTHWMPLPEGPK